MSKVAMLKTTSGRMYSLPLSKGQGPAWVADRVRRARRLEVHEPWGEMIYLMPYAVESFTIREEAASNGN